MTRPALGRMPSAKQPPNHGEGGRGGPVGYLDSMIDSPRSERMSPIRVLLLSPHGCGEHYNGPASFSHRLYGSDPGRFEITLLHGFGGQEPTPVIRSAVRLSPSPGSAIDLIRWVSRCKSWLRGHRSEFDVMHVLTGFHSTMLPAHYAQTELGLPVALFVANQHSDLGDKPGLRGLLGLARRRQRMARDLAAVIAMSSEIEAELAGYGIRHDRIWRIPMGVGLDRFRVANPLERANGKSGLGLGGRTVVAFSGQVVERKRPHLLIEAIAIAKRQGRDWGAVLAGPLGSPKYAEELNALVERHGLADRVKFLGFTREIENVYRAADAYCLPSENEGMPASVVEALASGLPCVITPFSGARDLVRSADVGAVVEPRADSIFEALDSLTTDGQGLERRRQCCRAHAESSFGSKAVLDAYDAMFQSIAFRSTNRTFGMDDRLRS
jgi:glycosyltransferase involved in cell wall biosynthesis